ncbi:MAG TPA: response regulator [Gallionellaceae bacterium]|nr:response regulator [Gallionellaceae bacterium]
MTTKEILVVDDEVGIRELLSEILFDEGYQVHLAENAQQAREFRLNKVPDLVLLDIWMPDSDGLSLLKEWLVQDLLTMPVVMMSGHGTIETALEATRIGAADFLEKPIALQKLLKTVATVMQQGIKTEKQKTEAIEQVERRAMQQFSLPLDLSLREAREHFDKLYFNYQMDKENGNVSRVADNMGIERTHLYRKLKQLGIKMHKKCSDNAQ